MAYGVKLRVWGPFACFTRPEMKVERVSYDVMTPSAARGILEAIHWKPAIRWVVDRIYVLRPVRFQSIRRNEVGHKIAASKVASAIAAGSTEGLHLIVEDDRQQRATTLLRDVDYVIEAHFEMTAKAGPEDNERKHREMFVRRASKGQCYHHPYLGCREFAADFALVEGDMPISRLSEQERNCDLGWMLHDFDFTDRITARFFRAALRDGVLIVPPWESGEVKA